MTAPRSRLDITPAVSWGTREALMINLVVADLFSIHALHSRLFYLNPSVFITQVKKIA